MSDMISSSYVFTSPEDDNLLIILPDPSCLMEWLDRSPEGWVVLLSDYVVPPTEKIYIYKGAAVIGITASFMDLPDPFQISLEVIPDNTALIGPLLYTQNDIGLPTITAPILFTPTKLPNVLLSVPHTIFDVPTVTAVTAEIV